MHTEKPREWKVENPHLLGINLEKYLNQHVYRIGDTECILLTS